MCQVRPVVAGGAEGAIAPPLFVKVKKNKTVLFS